MTEVKLQEPSNLAAWRVDLKKPLAAGAEQTIQVDVYLAKALQLYPEEISQREKQMVNCSFVFNFESHFIQLPDDFISHFIRSHYIC